MGDNKRYYIDNAAYFITTVTENRIELFKTERPCKILLITIEYFKLMLDYKLYGFCIMPDHLHLIIHPCGKHNFSYIMKMIKGSSSNKLNKINDTRGKIWQKGFYDECITNSLQLVRKLEYMHNNPVEAMITNSPEEYPYSSYNHYMETSYSANPIIEIDKLSTE